MQCLSEFVEENNYECVCIKMQFLSTCSNSLKKKEIFYVNEMHPFVQSSMFEGSVYFSCFCLTYFYFLCIFIDLSIVSVVTCEVKLKSLSLTAHFTGQNTPAGVCHGGSETRVCLCWAQV